MSISSDEVCEHGHDARHLVNAGTRTAQWCPGPSRREGDQAAAEREALLAVRRACVQYDNTRLATGDDVVAASKQLRAALENAGWRWQAPDA